MSTMREKEFLNVFSKRAHVVVSFVKKNHIFAPRFQAHFTFLVAKSTKPSQKGCAKYHNCTFHTLNSLIAHNM